ncbi:hypothetical protein AYO44_16565 [Planctomycetaceae bacterium SCGC AG-212-F19]|nr:hypothetical protein AYO44_16565 [Planctomycetaceae bacterium SCGC AG-212-F19]
MMLFWKIRYLDRSDKQFKDRYLYLHTKTLNPVIRAAVELVAETNSNKTDREILKYRHLFVEGTVEGPGEPSDWDRYSTVGPLDYLEDETGQEITHDQMAQIVTGNPMARVMPRGAKQHDIDYLVAERMPIPVASVSLSPDDVRLLGYFTRDLQEMMNSAFMKDGPGSLTSSSGFMSPTSNPVLETPATDDEIRSFVMIFRRLYMTGVKDPANFLRIIPIAVAALGDHPLGKWVESTAKQYENHLAAVPDAPSFLPPGIPSFSTKRLIDVFLYTQYAHQPDERREHQFGECLAELNGKKAVLTWLFLTEMWKCALEIGNAGNAIVWWFKRYCAHHGVSPNVINSLREDHSGLGAAEKEDDRQERLFREKAEQLAADLWEQAGRPAGGPAQFLTAARDHISDIVKQ